MIYFNECFVTICHHEFFLCVSHISGILWCMQYEVKLWQGNCMWNEVTLTYLVNTEFYINTTNQIQCQKNTIKSAVIVCSIIEQFVRFRLNRLVLLFSCTYFILHRIHIAQQFKLKKYTEKLCDLFQVSVSKNR